ncbi:MAG: hypothetical protein OEU86_06050 [Gammaproteobacteria bacterium]|nr:hypothetical protein [Gammaproteobacteria bacterium]
MNKRFMKQLSLLITFALMSFGAQSASITLDGNTATSISGLDVGGTLYDVSFQFGSWDDVGGSSVFPYNGDASGAIAASNAINLILANAGAQSVGESAGAAYANYYVPYSYAFGGGNGAYNVYSGGNWLNPIFNGYSGNVSFATMTLQAVPIPAAVWLFGSALGVLGWLRGKQTV